MRKKIVYCTPSLYIPGGVERVLTTKANYLAEVAGYDITIVLTDGKGKESYYPLSPKVKIVQLDINFEELWHLSFIKKVFVYLKKQRIHMIPYLFRRFSDPAILSVHVELHRICTSLRISGYDYILICRST